MQSGKDQLRNREKTMHRRLLWVGVCLSIVGCSTPKSRDEMLASDATVYKTCSTELAPPDAVQRLRAAWSGCFVASPGVNVLPLGQTVVASSKSRVIVTSDQVGATGVLIARLEPPPVGVFSPLSNSVFLMADIRETSECRSEVLVRAANSHWEKRAKQTGVWLANPEARPQEAGCNR